MPSVWNSHQLFHILGQRKGSFSSKDTSNLFSAIFIGKWREPHGWNNIWRIQHILWQLKIDFGTTILTCFSVDTQFLKVENSCHWCENQEHVPSFSHFFLNSCFASPTQQVCFYFLSKLSTQVLCNLQKYRKWIASEVLGLFRLCCSEDLLTSPSWWPIKPSLSDKPLTQVPVSEPHVL